jgi:deoxyribodipyrimidine photolyase
MENLAIEATKQTPKISFDADTHILEFQGESYPENMAKFATPIFSWLEEYLEQLREQLVTVNIELAYFNSSSSQMLLDLFDKLEEEVEDNSKNITVNWIYDVDNDNAEEYGEELQGYLESLTFNLVQKN